VSPRLVAQFGVVPAAGREPHSFQLSVTAAILWLARAKPSCLLP